MVINFDIIVEFLSVGCFVAEWYPVIVTDDHHIDGRWRYVWSGHCKYCNGVEWVWLFLEKFRWPVKKFEKIISTEYRKYGLEIWEFLIFWLFCNSNPLNALIRTILHPQRCFNRFPNPWRGSRNICDVEFSVFRWNLNKLYIPYLLPVFIY